MRTKRNHPPTCHSERTNVSRGIFPSCRFYLALVIFATWEDFSTPLRCGRNEIRYNVSTDSPTVSTAFYAAPLPSSGSPLGEPASPEGSFCTVLLGGIIQPYGLYTLRFMAMNHRRYIAWFHSSIQVIFGTYRAAFFLHIDFTVFLPFRGFRGGIVFHAFI